MINEDDKALILKSLMHSIAALTRSESIVLSLLLKNSECAYSEFEKLGVMNTYVNKICRQLNAKLKRAGCKFKVISVRPFRRCGLIKKLVRVD